MIIEAAALAFLAADYAYHRWFEKKPVVKTQPQAVSIPHTDDGAPYPLLFGRYRVRGAVLIWTGTPKFGSNGITPAVWQMNMLFKIAIPMGDGNGTARIVGMWVGDKKMGWHPSTDGSPGTVITVDATLTDLSYIGGHLTYYDGSPSQDPGAGTLGTDQIAEGVDVFQIPAYFGYLTAVLDAGGIGDGNMKWRIGLSPDVPAYSFEGSSYFTTGAYPAPGTLGQIGYDSNPANVLWSLLVDKLGKLGIPSTYLDRPSFTAAAITLQSESHGYSMSFEKSQTADQIIQEVLRQIDGALDEDPSTGKLVLTLVRPVDPSTIPHITRDNCEKLTNFVMSGETALPSSLRLIWTNRDKDYNDDSIVLHNQGNAVAQGETEEMLIEMRGCCEKALAKSLAAREDQARFRPIMKCRVFVGREFLRVKRGDAVKLTWSGPDLSGVVFRVADVNRGTIKSGKIALDLISDYYYTARGQVQEPLIVRIDEFKHLDDLIAVTLTP